MLPRARPGAPRPYNHVSVTGGGSGGGPIKPRATGGGGGGGKGDGGSEGAFSSVWAGYLALLHSHPMTTKSVTAGILNGVGDVIAQCTVDRDKPFDMKRLSIFTFVGVVMVGPALHAWYSALGRLASVGGGVSVPLRVAIDQLAFAPVFLSVLVSGIMALEGHGAEVAGKLRRDLFTIVRSNWAVWVPFQVVNFRFVPIHLQVRKGLFWAWRR